MSEIAKCPSCVRNADKSKWGDGPWNNEPDRVQWEHAGTTCIAHRGPHGAWCGYAAVKPGHRAHGQSYGEAGTSEVECHGGLTYAEKCTGCVCHVAKPGEPDDLWWFGMDFAHSGDYCPSIDACLAGVGSFGGGRGDHYWTLPEVQDEVNRLAEQLAV